MKVRNSGLALTAVAVLALMPQLSTAQEYGQLKWQGKLYMKFLDGNRQHNFSMSNAFDTTPGESGGDQGQAMEFDLTLTSQVSKQVEFYARVQSRLHRAYWANYNGFAVPDRPNQTAPDSCSESDPRCNWYLKLRGARVILTPGYDWIDSASIGSNDWGMFDAWTRGKSRYIDRDNLAGFLFQGSAMDKTLKWDLARVSQPSYAGAGFTTGELFGNDANYVGQLKYSPSPNWNAALIASYTLDSEVDPDDPNFLNGAGTTTRWDNTVLGARGQYSGFGFMDINGAVYWSDYDIADDQCNSNDLQSCRYSPTLKEGTDDYSFYLTFDIPKLFIDGLSLTAQYFDIGSDYVSIGAARRESDVLITEGQEATWMWTYPDYNTGNRGNGNSMAGIGYGGWNGGTQQVVSMMADNDVTDFDEPAAYSVIGWKGLTIIPKYTLGDWEFSGEVSLIDFNTNWQACGGTDKDVGCIYPRMDGIHSWGLGGDYRSPYAPYQDREIEIFALKAKYTLDVGKGIDLMARYKYLSDEDKRVTNAALLGDAYDGFPGAVGAMNPDWIPNVGLGGCVSCDDREADYDTYGISAGYQLTQDLYATLIYERHEVELIDGTIDVAPVGLNFEASNDFGFAEYMTGKHVKDRLGLTFSYILSGVQFGGAVDYFWGTYDPRFFTDVDGRRVRLNTAGFDTITTPLGNIRTYETSLGHYRMKIWMAVAF
jgi:hypothetical protein